MSWKEARQGAPQVQEALAPGHSRPTREAARKWRGEEDASGVSVLPHPSHGEQKDCLAASDTVWIYSLLMGFRLISTQDLTGGSSLLGHWEKMGGISSILEMGR